LFKWIVIALVGAYLVGFVVFASSLPRTSHDMRHIDGIVALMGGDARLDTAVALFEHGVGKRLLISGVNSQATKAELRKLAHGRARFDCCADLGYAAQDTFGNAQEAAAWARFYHYRKLLIVTARYHMPRSLSEFQAAMPDATLVPYPVDPESVDLDGWWHNGHALRVLNWEFVKYLAANVLTAFGMEANHLDPDARHGESAGAS
jgi:uncharacterized SAM-binding protein YcdF (DUF218 family)